MPRPHRVFVTGIGLNTPLAATREASWHRLQNGDRAIDWLDSNDQRFLPQTAGAPATPSSDLSDRCIERGRADLIPLLREPANGLALGAALEAVEHSGIDWSQLNPDRTGCVIGTSKGGVASMHELMARQFDQQSNSQTRSSRQASFIPDVDWFLLAPNAPALAVASLLNCQGACLAPVTACATGMSSLLRAAMLIQSGECDVVVAGSCDSSLTPAVVASFRRLGVLAQGFSIREEQQSAPQDGSDLRPPKRRAAACDRPIRGVDNQREPSSDPRFAVTPFDRHRSGFLIGEGAGVFIFESEAHIRQRGGSPLVEWLCGGMVSDAAGLTQLEPDPQALTWLIRNVIQRGQSASRSSLRTEPFPDYISLHGTATTINDRCEAIAVRAALGAQADLVPCSSIKGSIGHLLGGAGSVEFGFSVLAIRDQMAPPNVNLVEPDAECRLNFVRDIARAHPIRTAMKLSLGFGGHLLAALIERP